MRTNFRMEDEYITITRGDTLSFGIEIADQYGTAFDADTVKFTCRKNYSDNVSLFQKTLGNGISKVGDGQYIVRVAPEDTKDLEAGKYFYDLEVGANGDIFTIRKGVLELEHDVTF